MRSFSSHSPSPPLSITEIRRIVADEVSEQIRRYHNRNRLVFYNIPEDTELFVQSTFIQRILGLEVNIPYEERNTAFSIVRRLGKPTEDKVRPVLVDLKELPMPSLKELARKMKDPTVTKGYFPEQIIVRKMETKQQRHEGYLKRTERRKNTPNITPQVLTNAAKQNDDHIIVKSETTHEPVSVPVCAEFYEKHEDIPQAEFCMPNGFLHPALIQGTAESKTLSNFKYPTWEPSKPTVKATKEELISWKALDEARDHQWNRMKRNSDYYESANQLMRKSIQYYYDNDNFHSRVPWFVNDWKNNDKSKESTTESESEM